MQFNGIYTPIVTPFNADQSINEQRFAELIDFLVAQSVHGIIVAGTTGEYYALTHEERIAMMHLAKEQLNGRLPLIIGTGAIRTEDSIALARAARDIAADAILVTTPPYAVPTAHEIALHAKAVEQAANLPVMLYNYPGRMGAHMDEAMLDQLRDSPNFCAIKESSGDPNRLHLLAHDYRHLQLSCGMDDQALEFFAWGARSWVCAGSNFAPEAHKALYEACVLEGDFNKGRRIMSAMLPLMRKLEQGGKFVQSIKQGLAMRGMDAGPPRLPLQPLATEEKTQLEEVIHSMNAALSSL